MRVRRADRPRRGMMSRLAIAALLIGLSASLATAQEGISSALSQRVQNSPGANMVLNAREMIYDNDNNTVTAVGNVQIYYDGRVLQADRVVYDRKSSRVKAFGNVKITETDGTISYAETFDLTDDFRDGFVDALRIETVDKTRFAARRAERIGGTITVLEKGVYTACEPCKEQPEKPPLWQVKATRIIHNDEEKMVYFEDARLEFYGTPIAYLPFLSSPDPSVKRKSGILTPTYFATTELGFGLEVPYFFALAPNYDLTLTPGATSRQGPMMKVDWRHRTINGSYGIRAAGVFQMDPDAFEAPANQDLRGSLQSDGQFWLNERWRWGWDVTALSDKYFIEDYSVRLNTQREAVSTLYLTGEGDKSWFDARGYYFYGLTEDDRQRELPVIHPVIDYDYVAEHPVLGGEVGWNANITSLSREEADFRRISTNDSVVCDGKFAGAFGTTPENCIQRGIDGTYTRASANLYWKRTLTDSLGQQWTPFAYLRGDLAWTDLDTEETPVQLVDANEEFLARAMPAIGLEYRYPFIATMSWGTQVFEPIAQVIVRPRLQQIGSLPNEDAQSLVYDDTNLFEWDKFSGWDRLEDGSRVNAGLQYTLTTNGGGFYNILVGQSYSLGGANPFDRPDMANIGLDSGLETRVADYVARLYAQPTDNLAFSSRMRFDEDSLALERLEVDAIGTIGRLSGKVLYGRYEAQPLLGLEYREGVLGSASYRLNTNWTASGSTLYDIDREDFSSASVGVSYLDECFGMGATVSQSYSDSGNKDDAVTKVMFQLSLRTLGDVNFSQKFDPASQTQ
jgi:LPS-assembly protein